MGRRDHMSDSCAGARTESDVAPGEGESLPLLALTVMNGAPATILVVEDHLPTRAFLADNLSADGYELLEAESVAHAEQLIEMRFPDLAIVDLGLPDGDGLDLLRRVRAADRVAD